MTKTIIYLPPNLTSRQGFAVRQVVRQTLELDPAWSGHSIEILPGGSLWADSPHPDAAELIEDIEHALHITRGHAS